MARKEYVAGKAAGRQEGYTSTHFTPETAVIDLLKLIPFESGDVALDPSAGVNKVWMARLTFLAAVRGLRGPM